MYNHTGGGIVMTECEERILGWMNLGVDYEECLAPRCGRPATRWIPSHIDGKLMPTCDKHYNDPRITARRWNNARKWRDDRIRELIGKKCHYCGKQAVWWEDVNICPALDKYGNDIPSDYVPKWVPICEDYMTSYPNPQCQSNSSKKENDR